jgi:hypothetical protein
MKKSIVLASLLVLVACKDKRFCECLKVSDDLNSEAAKYSAPDFSLDQTTDEDVLKLKSLTSQKDSICQPYELLGGEELLKKKQACK